jgi:hypothetical protein
MRLKAFLPKAGEVSGNVLTSWTLMWRRIRAPSGRMEGRWRADRGGKGRESADKPGSVEDSHSSGMRVTAHLERPTRKPCGPHVAGPDGPAGFPIWSCSGWGLPCRGVLPPARCALTAPFHPCRRPLLRETGAWAVCFLWHFPWAHAPQALPGIPPCGARTFLCDPAAAAAVWPTPASDYISRQSGRFGKRSSGDRPAAATAGVQAPSGSPSGASPRRLATS